MKIKKLLAVSLVVAMLFSLAIVPAHAVEPTENSDIEIGFAPASLVLVAGDPRVREVEIFVTQDGGDLTLTTQHGFGFELNFPTQILDTEVDIVPGVAFDTGFSNTAPISGLAVINGAPGTLTPAAPMATLEIGPLAHTGPATGAITITGYDLALFAVPFWTLPAANFTVASLPVTFVDAVTALPAADQADITGTVVSDDAASIDLPATVRVNFTADVSAEFAVTWSTTDIDDAADGVVGDDYPVVGTIGAMVAGSILPAGFLAASIDETSVAATITAQVEVTPPGTRRAVSVALGEWDTATPPAFTAATLTALPITMGESVASAEADFVAANPDVVAAVTYDWFDADNLVLDEAGRLSTTVFALDWANATPATAPATAGTNFNVTVPVIIDTPAGYFADPLPELTVTIPMTTIDLGDGEAILGGTTVRQGARLTILINATGLDFPLTVTIGGEDFEIAETAVTNGRFTVAIPATFALGTHTVSIVDDTGTAVTIIGEDSIEVTPPRASSGGTFDVDTTRPGTVTTTPDECDDCGEYPCVCPEDTNGPTQAYFTDLGSVGWAVDAIETLARMNVVQGVGARTFNPDGQVTRQEFATMLMRLLEYMDDDFTVGTNANGPFTDVSAWAANYVTAAFEIGAVLGFSDTYFGASYNITRAHLALMIFRVFGEDLTFAAPASFTDEHTIPDYALDAVIALARAGIINGVPSAGGFAFNPNANATRAEAAAMLFRAFTALNGEFEVDVETTPDATVDVDVDADVDANVEEDDVDAEDED